MAERAVAERAVAKRAAKPVTVGEEAAAAEIEDLDGRKHRFDSLWADGTVVLVFLRHFG